MEPFRKQADGSLPAVHVVKLMAVITHHPDCNELVRLGAAHQHHNAARNRAESQQEAEQQPQSGACLQAKAMLN